MRTPVRVVLLGAAALAAPLAVAVMAPPALADLPPSREGRALVARFNSVDTNLDGSISLRELQALGKPRGADTLFRLLAEPDGRIAIKRIARNNPALAARLEVYDSNKDGYVSRAEFPNHVDPALFSALDVNHDGRVSLAELRPRFAGSRATPRHAPPQVRVARKSEPKPQPWCWVPGPGAAPWLGGRHWFVQVPVVLSPDCRTK